MTVRNRTARHAAHRKVRRDAASPQDGQSRRTPQRRLLGLGLADKHTLTGRASRALGWSFSSTILSKVSMFGVGVMLARLLGPHAFGTYAVAYVAMFALLNFNELGVSLAIVRWPGDPAEIVPTVTTISVVVSAIIYAGCFFAAPVYTSAMGTPAATSVIRVLAILVLSDGFTNTPAALLQRNFRQGQRTIADQVNVCLGTGVTVVLAWSGYGAMSLAIGRVAGCVAGAILLLIFAPESLRLGFDRAKARALLRFGLPLCGANFAAFAVGSVDQIVVGHMVGTVALGFYVLALNLAGWPSAIFSQPVRTVGPAVFARLQHDRAAMRSTFLSAAGLLCAVALPICLLISGSARPLIGFVYGTRWLPAARPLLWLALLGGVQVFFLLAYDFLVVLQRSKFLLATQLVWLAALVPALVIGARADGIHGASIAEFAVAAGCVLPWYLVELQQSGHPACRAGQAVAASGRWRGPRGTHGHDGRADGSYRFQCAGRQRGGDGGRRRLAGLPNANGACPAPVPCGRTGRSRGRRGASECRACWCRACGPERSRACHAVPRTDARGGRRAPRSPRAPTAAGCCTAWLSRSSRAAVGLPRHTRLSARPPGSAGRLAAVLADRCVDALGSGRPSGRRPGPSARNPGHQPGRRRGVVPRSPDGMPHNGMATHNGIAGRQAWRSATDTASVAAQPPRFFPTSSVRKRRDDR